MKIYNDIEQNTDKWKELRLGKITGSKLKNIVVKRGTKRKIGFYELMAERIGVQEIIDDPMERGHELEQEAIDKFSEKYNKKVDRVGFCVSDDNPNIAISPDGFIINDDKYTEGVEVKCLKSALHLQAYFEQEIPSVYNEQKLQYFVVNKDCQKLYFVFYDPRITALPIHTIEVNREDIEDEIKACDEYQEKTLNEIDELITKLTF